MDVSDNISPGIAWPPKQTTICPLGPSAVSPIASALQRFRPEFEARIAQAEEARQSVPVSISKVSSHG
jgi:NADH-quinone oxidoreductase subunit F